MSPPDNQPPALQKPSSSTGGVNGSSQAGSEANGPPSSSGTGPRSARKGALFSRSTERLSSSSTAITAPAPPPSSRNIAIAQSNKLLAGLAQGALPASVGDDLPPSSRNAPGRVNDEDTADAEAFELHVRAPAPRSVRPPMMPMTMDEFENRISREIPPPDRVDFDNGPPADGKDPYLGTTFDKRYKIEQIIGEGGMGFVYLARHKVIDKKVAIKVLRSDMARDRENLDRFLQEARAASSIGNPHIVDISDFGDLPDGSTYFVMEYLDGGSLSHLIDGAKRLPTGRLCHIALQMTAGLAAAHVCGIVHRDLKPDNVILISRGGDDDFVKILDFGIAKVMGSGETKLTVAGAVFGTPHYMSPEQAAGTPVDHRTDIYSLGVMLYEMVAGTLPFNADNFMAILSQHMYQAPTPIRELAPECSPSIEAIILKCLSKKPEARYQTMEELGEDLQRVKMGQIPAAVPEMVGRAEGFDVPPEYFKKSGAFTLPGAPKATKRPWSIYVGAALTIAAGTLAVVFALQTTKPPTPQPPAGPSPTAAVTAQPDPPPQPTPTPTPTPPPQPPPGPKKVSVGLAATPDTAVAYLDGKPLKLPSPIEVEEGKTVTVEVRADGYEMQTVILDGKAPIKLVQLNKVFPRQPGTSKTTNPLIVDPWKGQR